MEMDAQVRVLELESSLSQERERLGQLRRAHYHLAGEAEVPSSVYQQSLHHRSPLIVGKGVQRLRFPRPPVDVQCKQET